MNLVLWSFQSGGQELFALSTGRTPPAQEEYVMNWKRLADGVEATVEAVQKITNENASHVLAKINWEGYYTLDTKVLQTDWVRPSR